jgi:hypothetical protein
MPEPGRKYCAIAEIAYGNGPLPDEVRDVLVDAVRHAARYTVHDLTFALSTDPNTVVTVAGVAADTSPIRAAGLLETALDRALMTTGLFEEFDMSGKVMKVGPLEWSERLHRLPEFWDHEVEHSFESL